MPTIDDAIYGVAAVVAEIKYMTAAEAALHGVPESDRHRYFRLVTVKNRFGRPDEVTAGPWLEELS